MTGRTALAFLLAGLSLLVAVLDELPAGTLWRGDRLRFIEPQADAASHERRLSRFFSRMCALAAVLLGLQSLLGRFWDLRISSPSEPMPALIALYFMLVGGALSLLDFRKHLLCDADATGGKNVTLIQTIRPRPAEWLACGSVWLSIFALTASLLRISRLSAEAGTISVGVPASLTMLATSIGLLGARPQCGVSALTISATAGGTLMRHLVPVTLLVPPFGMWLLVELMPESGLFDSRLGTALGTLAGSTVVTLLEIATAARLAISDTERREHQAALNRALGDLAAVLRERDRTRRELERSNRDLDEFAYAASHDLRAPLRGIANLAQWIEEDLGPSAGKDTRQQLELLRGRVQRMETLIDDILKYSRAGRSLDPPRNVPVAELLAESIEMLAPAKSVSIKIVTPMPILLTERTHLQQVFLNLLSNAIKHAQRRDVHIEISAEDQGEFVRFVVADNGPGIAPQYQERIWGMFQTLASRDQVEGTGIGLATIKKLVERRGGRVGVESAEGQGARFFFLWPKHQAP